MRLLFLTFVCALAGACTHHYTPTEYPLAADRIPPVLASAPVSVANAQPRDGQERLFTVGVHTFEGSYRDVTQHLADQLSRALATAGVKVVAQGAPKRLDVTVLALSVSEGFYHFKGQVVFSVITGDGQRFDLVAGNGSPGTAYRTINGTLAVAVIEILRHPGIRAYLAA